MRWRKNAGTQKGGETAMAIVNIFCQSGIKTIAKSKGYTIYLLETDMSGEPYTKHWIEQIEETGNGAGVETALRALRRLKDPECELVIYTDSPYFEANIERAKEWQDQDWKDKKGNERKYKEKWEEILKILSTHPYKVSLGEHSYTHWLISELKHKQL